MKNIPRQSTAPKLVFGESPHSRAHEVRPLFLPVAALPSAIRTSDSDHRPGSRDRRSCYHHEVARDLTKDEERDVIKRTTEMILNRAKKRPSGWRSCTQSPNSLELLLEQGISGTATRFRTTCHLFAEWLKRSSSSCRVNRSVTVEPTATATRAILMIR